MILETAIVHNKIRRLVYVTFTASLERVCMLRSLVQTNLRSALSRGSGRETKRFTFSAWLVEHRRVAPRERPLWSLYLVLSNLLSSISRRMESGININYVTFFSQPVLMRVGARSHDFVVAIGFAHPPSSSPRDPKSIPL